MIRIFEDRKQFELFCYRDRKQFELFCYRAIVENDEIFIHLKWIDSNKCFCWKSGEETLIGTIEKTKLINNNCYILHFNSNILEWNIVYNTTTQTNLR